MKIFAYMQAASVSESIHELNSFLTIADQDPQEIIQATCSLILGTQASVLDPGFSIVLTQDCE